MKNLDDQTIEFSIVLFCMNLHPSALTSNVNSPTSGTRSHPLGGGIQAILGNLEGYIGREIFSEYGGPIRMGNSGESSQQAFMLRA
jgi:hypothetical protein